MVDLSNSYICVAFYKILHSDWKNKHIINLKVKHIKKRIVKNITNDIIMSKAGQCQGQDRNKHVIISEYCVY